MTEEEPPGFDIDSQGTITLFPVVTCRTAIFAGMTCGLRIEYRSSPDRNAKPEAIQFALTPEQCVVLSELLEQVAEQAAIPPPSGTMIS